MRKSESDVALEVYQSVALSSAKQKRLKSSTFWRLFDVKARHQKAVERVARLLLSHDLKISPKSGVPLGEEKGNDWIVLSLKAPRQTGVPLPKSSTHCPSPAWFETIRKRRFVNEKEVELYFIIPLLEKLGYESDDIAAGHRVRMCKGVQYGNAESDFAIFNGRDRTSKKALLVVEAKRSDAKKIDKGIAPDHVGQTKSYAQELLPAYYIVTNGKQVIVTQFNGMIAPDDAVMNFDVSELKEKWSELFGHVSKVATIKRKRWLLNRLKP